MPVKELAAFLYGGPRQQRSHPKAGGGESGRSSAAATAALALHPAVAPSQQDALLAEIQSFVHELQQVRRCGFREPWASACHVDREQLS